MAQGRGEKEEVGRGGGGAGQETNSKHWFTTSFLQPHGKEWGAWLGMGSVQARSGGGGVVGWLGVEPEGWAGCMGVPGQTTR